MFKKIFLIIIFMIWVLESKSENIFSAGIGANQLYESHNHGLIFNGYDLVFSYKYKINKSDSKLEFASELILGISTSRGILGLNTILKPISFTYLKKIDLIDGYRSFIGFTLSNRYQLSLYPDLQMGDNFWLTSYYISPIINISKEVNNDLIELAMSNSLLGLYSRTQSEIDPYYFSLAFSDIISDLHSDFKFGLPDLANNLNLQVSYIFDYKNPSHSLSYKLEKSSYYDNPRFEFLSHFIQYNYHFGGNSNE